MARKKTSKRRTSPFDPGYAPYGHYTGPQGNASQWRSAFKEAIGEDEAREILGESNPWAILGLKAGASDTEVKKAYRRLALQHHPDRGGDPEKFKEIDAAYTLLGRPR